MKTDFPKISVLIICYNQEKVISRAIESLLKQKDYIYEICVSDDCSPDNTWEVLLEYDKTYPGLFKLHRNETNVGIFENIEYTWTMPSGDIIYQLAGDDECGEGWLKTVAHFIANNKIDYKKERFCIYGDFKSVYPNGDTMILRNNLVKKDIDKVYLTLRTAISNRSTCFNAETLKLFKKVSKGKSHIAEEAIDIQLSLFSETFYYIPQVGNIYYANVGVSRSTSSDKYFDDRQKIVPYALEFLNEQGKVVDPRFDVYAKANLREKEFLHERNLMNLIKAVVLKLRSYDRRIGVRSIFLRQSWFAIRRRLPHKHPISITI